MKWISNRLGHIGSVQLAMWIVVENKKRPRVVGLREIGGKALRDKALTDNLHVPKD